MLATLGTVALNTSYEVDVTGAITGNGDHDNDGGGNDGDGNDDGGDDGNDVGPKHSHLIDRT